MSGQDTGSRCTTVLWRTQPRVYIAPSCACSLVRVWLPRMPGCLPWPRRSPRHLPLRLYTRPCAACSAEEKADKVRERTKALDKQLSEADTAAVKSARAAGEEAVATAKAEAAAEVKRVRQEADEEVEEARRRAAEAKAEAEAAVDAAKHEIERGA